MRELSFQVKTRRALVKTTQQWKLETTRCTGISTQTKTNIGETTISKQRGFTTTEIIIEIEDSKQATILAIRDQEETTNNLDPTSRVEKIGKQDQNFPVIKTTGEQDFQDRCR